MCSISAYEKLHPTCSGSIIIGVYILLPDGSTDDVLKTLCDTINFIAIWLQTFEVNMCRVTMRTNRTLMSCLSIFIKH